MRWLSFLCFSSLIVCSCSEKFATQRQGPILKDTVANKTVLIVDIIKDSSLNVRALELVKDQNAFVFLSSKGAMGVYFDNDKQLKYPIEADTVAAESNFRALAVTRSASFGISIGSPTKLYKFDTNNESTIVYQENHPKAFYDAMEFWNDQEGIAIGDPTDDCMSIIITRDGGNTWKKLPCHQLPKVKDGEAAFAASDTNIAIIEDKTWIATGGKSSRVMFSPDKGETWAVYKTPIAQGLETTGIYSVAFYDASNGFAIGGDYTKPDLNTANKIRTKDGGKTWHLVAENKNPGYRSCVQYVPNSSAKQLVVVGFKGIDYSNNSGYTWKHLSDEGFYTIRFINDSTAYAAGNGRISKLVFK
jgi:photosystem II stability/assembly factor-like uncharacterized protein